jgi:hypothetical protein
MFGYTLDSLKLMVRLLLQWDNRGFFLDKIIVRKIKSSLVKEEYLVKSNQVCTRMGIEISDCLLTIAKNGLD